MQNGAVPFHVLFSRHARLRSPTSKKSSLQENVATDPYLFPFVVWMFPLLKFSREGHSKGEKNWKRFILLNKVHILNANIDTSFLDSEWNKTNNYFT